MVILIRPHTIYALYVLDMLTCIRYRNTATLAKALCYISLLPPISCRAQLEVPYECTGEIGQGVDDVATIMAANLARVRR